MNRANDAGEGPFRLITHDIRNTLSCIKIYTDMLADKIGHDDEEAGSLLSGIRMCSDRVGAMVESLIDSVSGNGSSAKRESTDLVELVVKIAESYTTQAVTKGVPIAVEVAPRIPRVEIDRVLIERAVANLIDNAVKYTQRGGHITVRVDKDITAVEESVVVSVSDDGPGISVEEQGLVFEKLYRCLRDVHTKGYGLGLAVVKAAAEAHDGYVELHSEPGKGSEFRLVLPCRSTTD